MMPTQEHYHITSKTLDGATFINTLHEDKTDAALDFLGIIKNITKHTVANEDVTIEDVMNSMEGDGLGIYGGRPGLVIMLGRCEGGCFSPTWN